METAYAIKPIFELTIAGKNITQEVSVFLSSVEYIDKLEEESDEINIVLDDVSGLWQSDWYPQQGDALALKMGYPGNMLHCGEFEIDEIELRGQPDQLTVKALATAISKDMRTKNSRAYEKQTLKEIAQFIANKHGLKLVGDTSQLGGLPVGRKTQNNESDLAFLSRMCKQYGIIFSVRGDQLVFLNPENLENGDAIAKFNRSQLATYSFKDKTADTFEAAVVSKRDIRTNSVPKWRVENNADPTQKAELVVGGRVENESQAKATADGALRDKNKDKLTGSFSTDGNPLLVAGVNVEMEGFGAFSGKWNIKESRHKIDIGSGYVTDVQIRKGLYKKTVQPVKPAAKKNWANMVGLDANRVAPVREYIPYTPSFNVPDYMKKQ